MMRYLISLGDEKNLNHTLELVNEGSNNSSSNNAIDQGSLEEHSTLFRHYNAKNGSSSSTMLNSIQTL